MGRSGKKKIALPRATPINESAQANIDVIGMDGVKVFLVHRRVMTDMYKQHDLTGYEIDLLLLISRECAYDIDTVVTGATLRKFISLRFERVLRPMIDKLIYKGFIEKAAFSESISHTRIRITDKGLFFLKDFKDSLNKYLSSDGAELILNARYSWERAQKKDKE
jgi:DNA-binding MarR family transcriptional regulator